jgi:hypothetical protein
MRNKQNRLEKLFLDMVDRAAGKAACRCGMSDRAAVASLLDHLLDAAEQGGVRFSRIWVQTVLPSAITTTLYFVIFGQLIGERIGDMGGFAYMDFIVPGWC